MLHSHTWAYCTRLVSFFLIMPCHIITKLCVARKWCSTVYNQVIKCFLFILFVFCVINIFIFIFIIFSSRQIFISFKVWLKILFLSFYVFNNTIFFCAFSYLSLHIRRQYFHILPFIFARNLWFLYSMYCMCIVYDDDAFRYVKCVYFKISFCFILQRKTKNFLSSFLIAVCSPLKFLT